MIDENTTLRSAMDEEVVDVVVFRGDHHAAIPIDGASVVDLAAPGPLAREVCAELTDSTVRLLASPDVPSEAVDLLRQIPVPPTFQATPWLRHHRPLVLCDEQCSVGAFVLTYDADLGLCVSAKDGDR
ncbi:MAG TPA: hypothetical protein VJT49_10025 [Amycolatopsis sp.]|uniref:hypothetical protein n=1 Tax=Amycolatopsis sp. TaxID=37632 RepID=UPI002B48908C|nr:hypothetical protein [Amycolatopsis sp.]HKS45435.1 hypothetical protein [Amycolatopsis sp.]